MAQGALTASFVHPGIVQNLRTKRTICHKRGYAGDQKGQKCAICTFIFGSKSIRTVG